MVCVAASWAADDAAVPQATPVPAAVPADSPVAPEVDPLGEPLLDPLGEPIPGEAMDLGEVLSSGPAGNGAAAGGETHGLFDFRFRHYRSQDELYDFPGNPVLDYQESVARLSVFGGSSKLTFGLQGDAVALFSNEYLLDGETTYERELYSPGLYGPHPNWYFSVEKVWARGRNGPLTWVVGDSYAAFGRGYSLNIVKNTDIDVDTSLRGVQGTLSKGAYEVTLLTAFTNPQQVRLYNPNGAMQPDRMHAVHGVRGDWYGPVHVGVHGVAYQFSRAPDPTGDPFSAWSQAVGAGVVGATLEASSVGPFDLGAEFDYIRYNAEEIQVDSGMVAYVSASAYPGRTAILIEGKFSRDTEHLNRFSVTDGYELATGPSLEYERVITEDSSAAINSNDIGGGRVRADFAVGKGANSITPYASVAAFRDNDLGGVHFNQVPETIVHGLGGILGVMGEFHVLGNAGYRMDVRDTVGELGASPENPGDSLLHADLAVTVPLGHQFSLEIAPSAMAFHWGVNPIQQTDYVDFSNALAIKYGTAFALIAYTDFSNNELINSTGNLTDDLYGAGEFQWMPNSATTLKVFYGAYRAGIRCAGGQCRSLPGFDGARLTLTSAF